MQSSLRRSTSPSCWTGAIWQRALLSRLADIGSITETFQGRLVRSRLATGPKQGDRREERHRSSDASLLAVKCKQPHNSMFTGP